MIRVSITIREIERLVVHRESIVIKTSDYNIDEIQHTEASGLRYDYEQRGSDIIANFEYTGL